MSDEIKPGVHGPTGECWILLAEGGGIRMYVNQGLPFRTAGVEQPEPAPKIDFDAVAREFVKWEQRTAMDRISDQLVRDLLLDGKLGEMIEARNSRAFKQLERGKRRGY